MFKKNIKITNVYNQEETKECHFNLTRMELYDLQKKYKEGYEEHVKSIMETKNQDSMLNVFTELVLTAYCKIGDDGEVLKSDEIRNKFAHSEEYSNLMFELLDANDTSKAEAFFKAIMPKQLAEAMNSPQVQNKVQQLQQSTTPQA